MSIGSLLPEVIFSSTSFVQVCSGGLSGSVILKLLAIPYVNIIMVKQFPAFADL